MTVTAPPCLPGASWAAWSGVLVLDYLGAVLAPLGALRRSLRSNIPLACHPKICHAHGMITTLIQKNVNLPVRTSMRLERSYWEMLATMAASDGTTIHAVVQRINAARRSGTLSSAVRAAVLDWANRRRTNDG